MIVKCSYCKQILSDKNFDSHNCNMPILSVKIIEVAYFRDDSYNEQKRITGRGIDGILYVFEVMPRKAIPIAIPISRRKVTPFRADEDEPVPIWSLIVSYMEPGLEER